MIDEVSKRNITRTAFPCNERSLRLLNRYNRIVAIEDERGYDLTFFKESILHELNQLDEKAKAEIEAYATKEEEEKDSVTDKVIFVIAALLSLWGIIEVVAWYIRLMISASKL